MTTKRKIGHGGEGVLRERRAVSCILHVNGIQHGFFTALSNVQGSATDKLVQWHSIRDRRIAEPQGLPHHMYDVCSQIPESLTDTDLETVGYHWGCYHPQTLTFLPCPFKNIVSGRFRGWWVAVERGKLSQDLVASSQQMVLNPPESHPIDCFTPINQPFTDYSVIKELLIRSEEATAEVGQEYVLNSFELGGCMKALPLIWKLPDHYKKHVITPGSFHTGMN